MIEHSTLARAQARSLERLTPPPPVRVPRPRLGARLRAAFDATRRILAPAAASTTLVPRQDCPECA